MTFILGMIAGILLVGASVLTWKPIALFFYGVYWVAGNMITGYFFERRQHHEVEKRG